MNAAQERLAFGGAPGIVGPAQPKTEVFPDDNGAFDAIAETRDRVAYRALLAFTLVLFVRPQDAIPLLDLHLAEVFGTLGIVSLAVGRLNRGLPVTKITLEIGAVLAFAGIMLATAPFSIWPGGAISVVTDMFSKIIVVFLLIINTLTTRARFERFVNVVVVSCCYVGVQAVLDYARGLNLVEDGRVQGSGGLFGNPNDMALSLVAFLPLAISFLLLGRTKPLLRSVMVIGAPAMLAAIIFSKSRGGTLGLVGMLVALLFHIRRVRPRVAVAVVALSLVTIPLLPTSFTNRMSSIIHPEEDPTGSREARKRLLREAWQAYLDYPVFGLGAGQFHNYNPSDREETWREAHNAWLQVASELGTGGLLIFGVIVGSGFVAGVQASRALRRARKEHNRKRRSEARWIGQREPLELYAAAVLASLTGWLIAAMFASVAYYWTLYVVLGLAVTLRAIALRELAGTEKVPRTVRKEAA